MDNPEKLAVYDTQDEDKQKTQYGLRWTPLYEDAWLIRLQIRSNKWILISQASI
jgi:hypothetical protein